MTASQVVAPFVGAVAIEVVHWFQMRERLSSKKLQKLLRSPGYWITTSLMAVVGSIFVLLYFGDRLEARDYLLAGAGAPALLARLVSVFVTKETTLGEGATSWRDYFAVA